MKLLLIRHGETTGDIEDRYGGVYDDHLTETGKEQLAATAQSLINQGIQKIHHSPLIRARESAEIIQKQIGCELEQVAGLVERDYGILTGLTKVEALGRYPDAVEAHKNPMNTDPEGESFEAFDKRVVNAYKEIIDAAVEPVVILAHGGSLKRILTFLDELVPDRIGDGEVLELDIEE